MVLIDTLSLRRGLTPTDKIIRMKGEHKYDMTYSMEASSSLETFTGEAECARLLPLDFCGEGSLSELVSASTMGEDGACLSYGHNS